MSSKPKGRAAIERRLVDMAIPEQPRRYSPPPSAVCEEMTVPVHLPMPGHQLRIRQVIYKDRIVDFAVIQVSRVDDSWVQVARVDCDGGSVHRHQFTQDGVDLMDHLLLAPIPEGTNGAWNVIEEWFDRAVRMMEDEWEGNHWRWEHGE